MELYQKKPFYIEYDQELYNFRKTVEEILGAKNLEHLDKEVNYDLFDRAHDQSTVWHRKYYDNFDKFNEVLAKTDAGRCQCIKVECFENDNNSSIYEQ
jgi:hypothetical protein